MRVKFEKSKMVLRAGIEPARPQGTQDFLTNYGFRRPFDLGLVIWDFFKSAIQNPKSKIRSVCGLDYIFIFYQNNGSQTEAVLNWRFILYLIESIIYGSMRLKYLRASRVPIRNL